MIVKTLETSMTYAANISDETQESIDAFLDGDLSDVSKIVFKSDVALTNRTLGQTLSFGSVQATLTACRCGKVITNKTTLTGRASTFSEYVQGRDTTARFEDCDIDDLYLTVRSNLLPVMRRTTVNAVAINNTPVSFLPIVLMRAKSIYTETPFISRCLELIGPDPTIFRAKLALIQAGLKERSTL